MATFIVLHIPQTPGTRAREELAGRVSSVLGGAHLQLDCAWLVHSQETADDVRDRLAVGLPPRDGLLVLEIGQQAAWTGVTEEQAEWLVVYMANDGRMDDRDLIISISHSDRLSHDREHHLRAR
jgi:hypothetical protein